MYQCMIYCKQCDLSTDRDYAEWAVSCHGPEFAGCSNGVLRRIWMIALAAMQQSEVPNCLEVLARARNVRAVGAKAGALPETTVDLGHTADHDDSFHCELN
ncbi:unnamed protein product [Ostreobium quekettii]|uniref:Uncharacterized protein n=1 Tax=Ostreobium quekettii TaxID=121088 RepID=A0A8S1JG26_9CHLO|nr:unnamed protein product [Ostreobium quekettii]